LTICKVLTDFDGTIVEIDTGAYALTEFASGDWRAFDQQMIKGEITFEQYLRRQFGMINASIESIVSRIDRVAVLRPHFIELVNYCSKQGISLIIVSGGLDFYIRHILNKNNLNVEIYAPKCDLGPSGLTLKFPTLTDPASFSFKDDLVRQYRRLGATVLYVGDGYADYYALKEANVKFAITGSISARRCNAENISFLEISDFLPVIHELEHIETGSSHC
jgi:HAD superfamily phosphoserine phosphatase-like hydrolase